MRFFTFLFLFVGSSFAGNIAIGIQNGIGQSFELNGPKYGNAFTTSIWGYRGNVYSDFRIIRNMIIEPSISYSEKGSTLKTYETTLDQNGNVIDNKSNTFDITSRSQIVSLILGIKPFVDFDKFDLSLLAGPRIDYLFKRTIDNTPLGGTIQNITSVTTKWIPGINVDLGLDYKVYPFLVGLVFNNEIDLSNTKANFGATFRSYKYSIMLNVGYVLKSKKNG
jgi:hypothetical protein